MYTFIIEDNYESKKITVIKLLSYKILRSQKCLVQQIKYEVSKEQNTKQKSQCRIALN